MKERYTKKKGKPVDDVLVSAKHVVITALMNGMSLQGAAGLAGVSRTRFNEWRVVDRDFDDQIAEAQSKFEESLVSKVVRGADKDPELAFQLLKARFPAKWGSGLMRETEERSMQEQYDRFQNNSIMANETQLMNELDFRDRLLKEMQAHSMNDEEE